MLVVVAGDSLRDFGRAVHGTMREVLARLRVVARPARVCDGGRVAGVGADRGVAALERRRAGGESILRLVLHVADETATAAHDELAVPLVRQQQLETDRAVDRARDFAVRHLQALDTEGRRRCRPIGNLERDGFADRNARRFHGREARARSGRGGRDFGLRARGGRARSQRERVQRQAKCATGLRSGIHILLPLSRQLETAARKGQSLALFREGRT